MGLKKFTHIGTNTACKKECVNFFVNLNSLINRSLQMVQVIWFD